MFSHYCVSITKLLSPRHSHRLPPCSSSLHTLVQTTNQCKRFFIRGEKVVLIFQGNMYGLVNKYITMFMERISVACLCLFIASWHTFVFTKMCPPEVCCCWSRGKLLVNVDKIHESLIWQSVSDWRRVYKSHMTQKLCSAKQHVSLLFALCVWFFIQSLLRNLWNCFASQPIAYKNCACRPTCLHIYLCM